MAFREKMLWASLVATLGIWGWYFVRFAGMLKSGHFDQGAATGDFIMTVVLIVVVHIVAAIALAVISGKDASAPADDREKAFALAAYRPAYYALSSAVVMLMLAGPILLRIAGEMHPAPPAGLGPVLLGNGLLAALVFAELIHSGAQLLRFRIGG